MYTHWLLRNSGAKTGPVTTITSYRRWVRTTGERWMGGGGCTYLEVELQQVVSDPRLETLPNATIQKRRLR
jgi:hypothetical protein